MSFDPSEGNASSALAANRKHAWLAWQTEKGPVRVKGFDVGPGPDFEVTPRRTVTLPDRGGSSGGVAIGAWGSKVVIAYGKNGGTFARVSTDGGRTFGPREKLLNGIPGDVSTAPLSADIRGSRAVVHAGSYIYPPETVAWRFETTNDGASWKRVVGHSNGDRIGAFTVVGGETRLVETWDHSDDDPQRIRFHREL